MFKEQAKKGMPADNRNGSGSETIFYPLKFRPLYKDYIWGGRNFEKLGKVLPDKNIAESWEISAHRDGISVISNGAYEGRVLEDLILEYGDAFVGTLSRVKYKDRFPLLLKLIDANEWLSVQVHPEDSYAEAHENDAGKTEIWYVLDAAPDAQIIYGLNRSMDRNEFAAVINGGKIKESLRYMQVAKGDLIYIPAGTIHAAGKGILIAEVQQNSNATYRLYDYDRKNPDGTSRPLHIDKALDSLDFARATENGLAGGITIEQETGCTVRYMIADPHFCIQIINMDGSMEFGMDGRSFHALIATSGQAELAWEGGKIGIKAGESVLIPAGMKHYRIEGTVEILKSFIGDIDRDVLEPLKAAGFSENEIRSKIPGLDR